MRREIQRVLLVGLGSIGKRHLGNLKQRLPQARIATLRSSPPEKERNDGVIEFSVLQDAIDFQPDIALICNPAIFHLPVAQALADAGVDLLIEKPLAADSDGVAHLQASAARQGLKVMVGYNLRFSDSLKALRSALQSGACGKILCVRAEVGQYLPDWRPDSDYRKVVSAQRALGGGALLELSHELDYLRWLFGTPVRVSGDIRKVSALDIDVEDLVFAQFDCLSDEQVIPVSLQLDFLQRKVTRTCKVVCEEATLVWSAVADRVEKQGPQGTEVIFQGGKVRNDTYERELDNFVTCVTGGEEVPISLEDGLQVLRMVEALRRSSEQKRWVEL